MKKILVFGITDKAGGVESVIMNYYRKIDKTKIMFDFLCNNETVAYEEEITSLGGKIYRITARSKNFRKYRKDLKQFFVEHAKEYSTIWVNVCSLANIDYLKYAKKYGIKYRIIHSHNSKNMDSKIRGFIHKFNKIVIKKYATDFWACSEDAGSWFYNKKIISSKKYLVINNAIDTEKYKFDQSIRDKARKNLKLEDKLVIGNIGRFHFQKNHEFIINVFAQVLYKNPNARLLLVGKGSLENKIREKAETLKIIDKVMFLGERDDVEQIMQAIDILLFPSLFEGLPLTLIEAQANGMPILASKHVIPEKVKMSNNLQFISLDKDAKYWADILLNTDLNNKSIENIKYIKNKGFDINTETKKIENLFERK